ncbi:GEL complex subunit OPTI-like [Argiope bruennichi]|uniref:Respirasome Complex Assembly Factor 1 like protein n=1 Tax=Argiope bruennichi TaxID=94029 RepID=A0A8T0EUR9_ARGBR|nr:GEL complex subunit OPTI-like [Argiope bruennichi]KAF8781850.1 Respirasome Complex Assembly Factor 1 like protein [Argiope bruennichi]
MNQRKKSDKNGSEKSDLPPVLVRMITPCSSWPIKDEFLDVIYWTRQILAVLFGIIWGIIPIQGIIGIALYCLLNIVIFYSYSTNFQHVDDEEFGGIWELLKEGFMTAFACFLVTWIVVYSYLHFDG